MQGLKTGFEYPAELFAALKKNLDIKKGALLLPENDTGIFAPWSISGFDKTTQRRMRIAPDLAYETFRISGAKIILTDLSLSKSLAPCFSSREAALAERLLLCFFTSNDKIDGILLIADSPWLFLDESVLRLAFTVVAELASGSLARARSARLHKRRDQGHARKDRFLSSLKSYTKELAANAYIEVFTLDAKPLAAKIRESSPDIDEYRVMQDITAVVGTLLEGSPVYVSNRKKKILAVTREGQFDPDLLAHQISLMIQKLFQGADGAVLITKNSLACEEAQGDITGKFL